MRNDEKSDKNAKGIYVMCPSDSASTLHSPTLSGWTLVSLVKVHRSLVQVQWKSAQSLVKVW